MRLHRFIGNFDLNRKQFEITDPEILNQFKNVLRLKKGEEVMLGDGALNEALAKIMGAGKNSVSVEIVKMEKNACESGICGILYCSILKRENFEWVCQKATEAGIREIVPIISSRTVKLGLREDRIEKIIKEAAEQSGRGVLPKLGKSIKFGEALENAGQNDLNLFFEMGFPSLSTADFDKVKTQRVGIFIGPEGGWDPKELEAIRERAKENKNFRLAGLGKLTLRAETAAVVAAWSVCQLGGQ